MAPARSAVSPLSGQSYPVADSLVDGDLQSDDELDSPALAARRQRIESLAESYLQGKPVFIMSASLKGPFDREWVNPWRKSRRKKNHQLIDARGAHRDVKKALEGNGSVVPESEPRRKPVDATPQNQSKTTITIPRTRRKDGGLDSCPTCTHVAEQERCSWLRTTRHRPHIFDLPASPSKSLATKIDDSETHLRKDSYSANKSASRSPRPQHPRPELVRPVNSTLSSRSISPCALHQESTAAPITTEVEPGSVYVDSKSNLPTFEYRRPRDYDTAHADCLAHNDAVYSTNGPSHAETSEAGWPSVGENDPTSATHEIAIKCLHSNTAHDNHQGSGSGSGQADDQSRDASEILPSSRKATEDLRPTGSDETIRPDGEEIPQGPSYTDASPSPEAPFSTQAAVLLAQLSFQNDLERAEKKSPARSENRRNSMHTPNSNFPHSAAITPFSKNSSHVRSQWTDSQAISTQRLIEEVTPSAFGTDRKRDRHVAAPGDTSTTPIKKMKKRLSFAVSSPEETTEDVNSRSEIPNQIQRHESGKADDEDQPQQTGFPLSLTCSTPPTAQNREMSATNSNLDEAIDDAGRWLDHGSCNALLLG